MFDVNQFFVPWDYTIFKQGIGDLMLNLGNATTIGFGIFLIVSGVYLVVGIVRGIGK